MSSNPPLRTSFALACCIFVNCAFANASRTAAHRTSSATRAWSNHSDSVRFALSPKYQASEFKSGGGQLYLLLASLEFNRDTASCQRTKRWGHSTISGARIRTFLTNSRAPQSKFISRKIARCPPKQKDLHTSPGRCMRRGASDCAMRFAIVSAYFNA